MAVSTLKDYLTWYWTREGFLVLTGVVASVGWLKYSQPGKPSKVWVDATCLSDEVSIDTLRGKSATIDHTTQRVNLDNIGSSEVGRVSRVWFDKSKGEQRASVLVTDKQLLDILRLNDRTEIGFSPYYDADLDIVDGKITQRNRYYNNLSLLFLTVPRGEKSYVFMDSQNKVGSNMTIEELKAQIAAVVANVDAFASSQKGNADSQDDPANTGDRYAAGYEEGLKAGIEHGEALAYADSLSIAVLPTDNLSQILEKVATKITGKVVKAGETPAFYKGMITGNINVFEDSARQNPRKKVQDKSSPAAIAQAAHEKAINARYAPKETAKT